MRIQNLNLLKISLNILKMNILKMKILKLTVNPTNPSFDCSFYCPSVHPTGSPFVDPSDRPSLAVRFPRQHLGCSNEGHTQGDRMDQ